MTRKPKTKSLHQLKSRLAWEIQALTDRAKRIVALRKWPLHPDHDATLESEHRQIVERIDALRLLDKARRGMSIFEKTRRRMEPKHRSGITAEIKSNRVAIGELR